MKCLRRLVAPRQDGSFLVPKEIVDKFKDIIGGGQSEVMRMYEQCGCNKDPELTNMDASQTIGSITGSKPYPCFIPLFHNPRSVPLLVHVGLLRAMLGPCWAYVGSFGGLYQGSMEVSWRENHFPNEKCFVWEMVLRPFWEPCGIMWGQSWSCWAHVGLLRAMLGPCWAYFRPWWAYVGPRMRGHLGPNFRPHSVSGSCKVLGLCWALWGHDGPTFGHGGPMLGQERRGHLGPNFTPQMNTLFPGHVKSIWTYVGLFGAMLGPCWPYVGPMFG